MTKSLIMCLSWINTLFNSIFSVTHTGNQIVISETKCQQISLLFDKIFSPETQRFNCLKFIEFNLQWIVCRRSETSYLFEYIILYVVHTTSNMWREWNIQWKCLHRCVKISHDNPLFRFIYLMRLKENILQQRKYTTI